MTTVTIDPVSLTRQLIRCPSITPRDEGAQAILTGHLKRLGFECRDLPFGPSDKKVKNFFARYGSNEPHICFCGHTDIVPSGDEALWTHPPFDAVINDGRLYGRGASDMKGNIASFMAALSVFLNTKFTGSISLLITGDEEGPSIDGTVKVLKWMEANNHIPDLTIVGEPTNPENLGQEIKIGRRGSLSGKLTVNGKQGHVAYHELAANPLPDMITLLDTLNNIKFDSGSDHFPATNLEITTIDVGNTAGNVIPVSGHAIFNVRFNDKWTAATLEHHIRSALTKTGLEHELQTESNAESFLTVPGEYTNLVAQAVKGVTGKTPALTTNGGTSDARFIHQYCPVVECGLVNKTIHQIDEYTNINDLKVLSDIYLRILQEFFK